MPIYLEETDVVSRAAGYRSVLVVPCRFCPAASMAVRHDQPYVSFFRSLLKTGAYEQLIDTVVGGLRKRGVKADVFRSRLLHQFVLCMWSRRRRDKLRRRAREYEAVVVMGCDAAVQTVRDALGSTGCQVVSGMASKGLMVIQPRLSLPADVSLELARVSPVAFSGSERADGRAAASCALS